MAEGCWCCGCTCQQTAEFSRTRQPFSPLSTPTSERKEQAIVTPFVTQASAIYETTNVAEELSFPFHTEENVEESRLPYVPFLGDRVVDSLEAEVILDNNRILSLGVNDSNSDGANTRDLRNSKFAGISDSGLTTGLTVFDRNRHANEYNSRTPFDASKTIAHGTTTNVLCQPMCPFDTDDQAEETLLGDFSVLDQTNPVETNKESRESELVGVSNGGVTMGGGLMFEQNQQGQQTLVVPPIRSKNFVYVRNASFVMEESDEEAAPSIKAKSPAKKTNRAAKRPESPRVQPPSTFYSSPSPEIKRMIQEMYDKGDKDEGQEIVPRELDILMGKGSPINNHTGNITFRKEVKRHHSLYDNESDGSKFRIAHAIVHSLVLRGSRFLRKDEKSGVWQTVSLKRAYDKTQQALRDGAVQRRQAQYEAQKTH